MNRKKEIVSNKSLQIERLNATRFYGILDTGYVSKSNWSSKYEGLAQGGAGIVQIRAKRESASEREHLLARILEQRETTDSQSQPLLVINDDIDLCLRYPEIGLHIGQDDTPPAEARDRIGPERLIGLSTHSIAQATAAMEQKQGVIDYFAVGPVFATQTKPDYEPVGLDLVRWVAAQSPAIPFFCIGGINRANVAQVSKAGARRVVSVSDVLLAQDTSEATRETILLLQ